MKLPTLFILLFSWALNASAQTDSSGYKSHIHQVYSNKFIIEKINFKGNKRTHASILLRELNLQLLQEIAVDSLPYFLKTNCDRLYNTSLFTDVSIGVDTVAANIIHLNIWVKERWYIYPEVSFELADRNFNVWWTEQNRDISRSVIGVSIKQGNLFGNREQLTVTTQLGYRQEFGLGYSAPFIDKEKKHGAGFKVSYSQNKEIFYATDSNKLKFIRILKEPMLQRVFGAISYSYRPQYATTHLFHTAYNYSKIADTIAKLNPEFYYQGKTSLEYLEASYRIEVNHVDNWNYPLHGLKVVGNVAARFVNFKDLKFYAVGTLELGKFDQLKSSKFYTSFIFRGKLSLPVHQPYVMQQGLGTKYEYVRGYEMYVIDGYHFGLGRGSLKYELLNYSIKNIPFRYLPVLPLRIYPKIFADAGYVYNPTPGNSFLNNQLLYSVGAGFDFVTAYDFKLRVEYVVNHLGQKGLFLHINSE